MNSYVCMSKNAYISESFIIGPVTAVNLPEGNKVEMRDGKTHGRPTCTHTHPVPSNGHACLHGVFQVDIAWMKRAGRKL